MFCFSVILMLATVAAQQCGPRNIDFSIAGSSTVEPVAETWAEAYQTQCPGVGITVEGGGSSAGAGRVCANDAKGAPVDIGNMSREWKETEGVTSTESYLYQCVAGNASRAVIQIEVAIDGLSVTTQAGGAGTDCVTAMGGLTTDQLRWIYSSYNETLLEATGWDPTSLGNSDNNASTHLWSELSSDCAPEEIKIAGADDQSGTYDYFKETIFTDHKNGETFGDTRPYGYFNSKEDEDIVLYLEANPGDGIGYFGYSYYYENRHILDAAPIQNQDGDFILPSATNVENGVYNPLARRIYMNLLNDETTLEYTAPFVRFGLSEKGTELVSGTGYVPIPESDRKEMLSRLPEETVEAVDPSNNSKTSSSIVTTSAFLLNGLFIIAMLQ